MIFEVSREVREAVESWGAGRGALNQQGEASNGSLTVAGTGRNQNTPDEERHYEA